MKITEITTNDVGVGGTTGEVEIEKGIGALMIAATSVQTVLDARIRVWIESQNGVDEIIDDVSVMDALLMGVFGDSALQSEGVIECIGRIPLTKDGGAISLLPQQKIKMEVKGLYTGAAHKFMLYGTEEPLYTSQVRLYEKRNLTVDQTSVDLNVLGFDMLVIPYSQHITEIQLTWSNGSTTRHTLFELMVDSKSIDPIQYVKVDGTVGAEFSRIFIPLSNEHSGIRISSVNFRKVSGNALQIALRQE